MSHCQIQVYHCLFVCKVIRSQRSRELQHRQPRGRKPKRDKLSSDSVCCATWGKGGDKGGREREGHHRPVHSENTHLMGRSQEGLLMGVV